MARSDRVLIVGGSGVFGQLLARELLEATTARLVLAGRDRARVEAAARNLRAGERVSALPLDLANSEALARAAEGCAVVACTAGPFHGFRRDLARQAVRAGAHWLDLSDDAEWIKQMLLDRGLDCDAKAASVVVIPGLSTVPTLSGALTRWCLTRRPDAIRGRVTLYIGNRNHKGAGAILSALHAGLTDPTRVDLPVGRRVAFRFGGVDPTVWRPSEAGIPTEFCVAFEIEAAARLVAALSRMTRRWSAPTRQRLGNVLAWIAAPLSAVGTPTGCLQAEVWAPHGARLATSLLSRDQRMAVVPLAAVVESLLAGTSVRVGVLHPMEWRSAEEWLTIAESRGIHWSRS